MARSDNISLTDEEIGAIVDAEFETSMGAEGGTVSNERAKAYDYYLSKKRGDEIDGQSQVVSSDASDVVGWFMPSLLRIFTTADNLLQFKAVGSEDEPFAEQESDYVNYVFFKQNKSFEITYAWFFDALVQKNGIVKAWWDTSERITQESYKGLSEIDLFKLMDDEELEPVERSERIAETVDERGQIVEMTVYDVTFRRVSKRGRVKIENVPPEEYRISSDSRSLDPSDARFVGQEREVKRSDLLDMGFDAGVVEDLPTHGNLPKGGEQIARRDKTDDTSGSSHDKSQDTILLREGFIRIDADGDGRAELMQVFRAGNKTLSSEPADRQSFHVICPEPLPHKHFGRSLVDKVIDVQDVTTVLTRQTLDNLYHSNMPAHGVWQQAMGDDTMDALLTVRPGRVIPFDRPVGESYQQMAVPFTAASSFSMLEYYDKVKRERTGVSANSEGLSPEALKNIQTSVLMQAVDMGKMKQELVARLFADTGFKTLFLHIHELVMKHQDKVQIVKLRNKWVEVDPGQWRTRTDTTVNIGLGIGTREQNLMHIQAIRELQSEIVKAGGMNLLVTPDNIYNTASEMVKNANFKQPEMFFTDPKGKPAPPPSTEQEQLQKAQMQLKAREQQLDGERQQINAAKQKLAMAEAAAKHAREVKDLELKQQKINNDHDFEMEKIRNELTKMELESGRDIPGSKI